MMWLFGGGGERTVMASDAVHDRRISFVYSDAERKFRVSAKSVEMLESLKDPVAVVAVCGRVHSGKSFILNQLLESSAFEVSLKSDPCTYSLWLSNPIRRIAPDGSVCNILLLDTEGIDALNLEDLHSIQMVSLASLLSSLLIYNQVGCLDEVELSRLSLMIEMAEHIRHYASQGKDIASMLKECSPIFLLLLRDSPSWLVEGNRQFTPQEYIEHIFRRDKRDGNHIAARNKVVESIQAFFPERECRTLVSPVTDENDLHRLDHITSDELRPEFREGLTTLRTFIMERTRAKEVGRAIMTGPTLVRITQMFLDVLNHGGVSTISSAWENNDEIRCLRAYFHSENFFIDACNHVLPSPYEVVSEDMFDGKFQTSMAMFDKITASEVHVVREKYRKLLRHKLEKNIKERCYAAHRIAQAKAEKRAKILHIKQRQPDARVAVEDMYFSPLRDIGAGASESAGENESKMKLM